MLVLFIFPPGDIILAFLAIVTGIRPVEFPFKVFVPGDLPSVKFLLAQKPFVHELVHKAVLKVNPHGRMDGPVVVVIVAHAGIIGGPCLAGIADKLEQADSAWAVLVQPKNVRMKSSAEPGAIV